MTRFRSRLPVVVLDQGLATGSILVLLVLIARPSSPSSFGRFLVVFGLVNLVMAVSRAALAVPLSLDLPVIDDEEQSDVLARSLSACLSLGAVAALTLGLILLAPAFRTGPEASALLVLVLSLPVLLAQEVGRYAAVADGRPGRALLADTLWCAPVAALLLHDLISEATTSPLRCSLLWAGSCSLGTLWVWRGRPPAAMGVRSAWQFATGEPRRRHLALDAAMSALTPAGNGAGAASIASPVATSAVRGAAALYTPLTALTTALTLGVVPEARRRGGRAATRLLDRVTLGLIVSAVAWAALLLSVPDGVGLSFLGASWEHARSLVPIVAVEYIALAAWSGATSSLRVAGATAFLLRLRLLYAPAALVLPVVALAITSDPRWFAVTLAGLAVLLAGSGLAATRRVHS